jgi:4-amino-4-deoxy-L-arabinose transferase-like glycosyltransferase
MPAEPPPAWRVVAAVVALAAIVRLFFYAGFFGSDEVTYVASAYRLLEGDWTVPGYVGANRYGVNLPIAALGWLFGRSEASAAAFAMSCSLLEVGLVARLGGYLVGARAAVLAALLLSALPLHVHFAGRLMADSPFALALTAAMLLFARAEQTRGPVWWFAAGCAAGFTFWIKPAAVFVVGVLLAYPLLVRRLDLGWVWVVAGFAAVVLANHLFYLVLTDQFWYILRNMAERRSSGYMEAELDAGLMHNQAGYYLVYLFAKVYHTWLLGPLAVLGAVTFWRRRARGESVPVYGGRYVLMWGLGLMALLSLLVVSIRPLALIPKQTNYMLIFVAPLCLLGGMGLAELASRTRHWLVAAWFLPALALCALLQASVSVFTANSKASVAFARALPDAVVFAASNGYRAAQFDTAVQPHLPPVVIHGLMEAVELPEGLPAGPRFAIVDLQTLSWSGGEPFRKLDQVPSCWQRERHLVPVMEGAGTRVLTAWAESSAASLLPAAVAGRLSSLVRPEPAVVYRMPAQACP